ncbi:MAG: hypothetical protein L0323_08290 [Planctomycetes bacterium]|nr:hypothetical protein [Planctomycetota bacterium]
MSSAALASLAILKVNWDRLGRDYIENFVPFVAEALRLQTEDVVSLPVLQQAVRARFALDLPLNPIRQVLQRCAKHGFVEKQSGVFYRDPQQLQDLNFSEVRQVVLSLHERLLSQLREFVKSERGIDWSEEQAAAAIHSFLVNQSLKFLYAQAERTPLDFAQVPQDAAYLVALFLMSSRDTQPTLIDDFAVLVKGHLLANAIYLPDPGKVGQRFRDTSVFLDTSVIVDAAGFAGPERHAPCGELLQLLREYGASLHCFEFTMNEVRRILDACAARLRTGHLRDAYGPTIEWFIESGRTSSDIELMIARLPERLRSLGITVDEGPPRDREFEFQVDEEGFEKALEGGIGYKNPKARVHDVDAVSLIAKLRRGRHSFDVESCRAVFVTTNYELASIARRFFQADAPEGAVALCITDYSLGNLLWLKNPTRAPELPHKLLIADAFAALQPPDALWKLYLAEIARLQERGDITTDEYFALRHGLTAKRALMELTGGLPAVFTEGTVAQVLKVAKEHLRADLQEQLGKERQKRETAENIASGMELRDGARHQRLIERAGRLARISTHGICGGLLLVLTVGALLTFPWGLPGVTDAWYRYGTTGALIVFFVYTIANIVWGTSVAAVGKRIENRLSGIFHTWLTRISE